MAGNGPGARFTVTLTGARDAPTSRLLLARHFEIRNRAGPISSGAMAEAPRPHPSKRDLGAHLTMTEKSRPCR
jgi:hypothetical protein